MTFHPFPILSTERLLLRKMTHADAPEMLVLRSDKEIMRYIPRPRAKNTEDAIAVIDRMNGLLQEGELINWGITLKGSDKVIGTICLMYINYENQRAEVGYLLHGDMQRKGIMQEALSAVLHFGFDTLKLHSMEAITDPDNIASISLLLKNGFVQEAHFKENGFYDGVFLDSVHYSLMARDFAHK